MIRLKPDWPDAHVNLGTALAGQGKPGKAEAEYREAIHLKPNWPEAHCKLGSTLCGQGKVAQAEAEFREAIRLEPDWPEAHHLLGSTLGVQGNLPGAVTELRKAIRLKPDWPEAHHLLATALAGQGQLGEAEAEFREAIRLKPDQPEVHYSLGYALSGQGKLDQAGAEYREAIRLKPDFAQAHNDYAWLLATCRQSSLRNPSQAVELAKKATELAPKEGGYWNTLGVAYYRAGDWQAATTALERSMVLQKGGEACDWLFLAMARWQLGQKEDARKWYKQALVWMDKNKSPNEELSRFRAEARALFERQGPEASKHPEIAPHKR